MGNDVSILWIIVGIIGIVIAVALAINLADYITFFRKELRHLNQEIGRTSGREQRYWKKRNINTYIKDASGRTSPDVSKKDRHRRSFLCFYIIFLAALSESLRHRKAWAPRPSCP